MPAQPKHETLARLLELLQAIPHRRYASPQELTRLLAERGFPVDVRSVQRDLQMLREHFPLEVRDDSKPHGWRWISASGDGITGMSAPEALMVALVERHLQAALPASMLESFAPVFERAHRRLARLGPRSATVNWPAKIRAVPPGLATRAPSVSQMVRRQLSEALLHERQVDCLYAPGPRGASSSYRLHPLGLLLRGGTAYLVATRGGGTHAAYYALHRFREVEMLAEPVHHPAELNLDTALQASQAQFGTSPGSAGLRLVLACSAVIAGLLEESPLSADQRVKPLPDGRFEVQATVPESWELNWWLLGRGAEVEVISPPALRRLIAQTHRAAAARYADDLA